MSKKHCKHIEQRNRYLDDLGLDFFEYSVNWTVDNKKKILKIWKRPRKKYGFDNRETYDMFIIYAEWLYSHFMMYRKRASKEVDLTYHRIEFEGKRYTEIEAIDKVLKWTRYYLLNREDPDRSAKAFGKLRRASRLWTELLPYVSW